VTFRCYEGRPSNAAHPTPTKSGKMPPLGTYAHLLPPSWSAVITSWLAEDTPAFDYGGFVVGEQESEAFLFGKQAVSLAAYLPPGCPRLLAGRAGRCPILRRSVPTARLQASPNSISGMSL
jgi:hypothetical protein